MNSAEEVIKELKEFASSEVKKGKEHFGIQTANSYGLTMPQLRSIAKRAGKNHVLALKLWKTGIHEAQHIAVFIADPKKLTESMMEEWLKDFNSWDIVDNCCATLFAKTTLAFQKAIEWTQRKNEFEKRAGFAMMAVLAVHDKKSENKKFEQFFPFIISESHDERNFVKKAINWALRQIGKRNEILCMKAIDVAKQIHKKDDAASGWIAGDALRELQKYLKEGRIKKIGIN
ncbi:MAG: DNA alkylation repair protein [Chitinophagales bacterium]